MPENTAQGGVVAVPRLTRVIVAATIGNILEWFDFLVYGFFAATLAEVFFPTGNSTISLLITFGTFGLSYLVRPLGAVVIGTYTDRAGRKAGLTLSIALMMIGTTLMVEVLVVSTYCCMSELNSMAEAESVCEPTPRFGPKS